MSTFWKPLIALLVVAASAYGQVPGQASRSVPKYLESARELVSTVTPENNKYEFNGPQGVRWKGDLFTSENSVKTACGPFVAAVFERAKDSTLDKIRDISRMNRSKYVRVTDWTDAANKQIGMKQIKALGEVQPGDLFIFSCHDECGTSQGDVPGHIAIVDVVPTAVSARSPFGSATFVL